MRYSFYWRILFKGKNTTHQVWKKWQYKLQLYLDSQSLYHWYTILLEYIIIRSWWSSWSYNQPHESIYNVATVFHDYIWLYIATIVIVYLYTFVQDYIFNLYAPFAIPIECANKAQKSQQQQCSQLDSLHFETFTVTASSTHVIKCHVTLFNFLILQPTT